MSDRIAGDRIAGWGGAAVVALAIIGVVAFVGGVVALLALNVVAAGICLAAAAIAFSGIANVVFRQ